MKNNNLIFVVKDKESYENYFTFYDETKSNDYGEFVKLKTPCLLGIILEFNVYYIHDYDFFSECSCKDDSHILFDNKPEIGCEQKKYLVVDEKIKTYSKKTKGIITSRRKEINFILKDLDENDLLISLKYTIKYD